jgi:hypothetical protein
MNDPLGIGSLLPDVLQDVMSAQFLQNPLQVFFCSDEVWNIETSGVVLARMVIPQHSSLDVPQDKIKRQVDLEGCGLLSVQGPYHLWKGGRCHLMECNVVPLLYRVAGRLYGWTANVVYARLWSLGPLATRLVQQDSPGEFWVVVTRYVSALGWVLVQVLLVSSSVVSAWPLVSRAGHDGVLGCPVC